ncbi:MAG: uncharacterized membrane-anchored protein YitT (DUF2179 family) [Candidatus Marinamargulisbacteria bacterium]|jgi:uncharacterized membrane-anchored protein YitT (DUF2179 family)
MSKIKKTKTFLIRSLSDTILIGGGIALAFLGLQMFLIPNRFIDGGVTGLSMLVSEITGASLWMVLLVINIPFVLIGFSQLGRRFAILSMVSIIGLAASLALFPVVGVTQDKLLAAVFGGICLGAGIGLTTRGSGALDGTDLLAIVINKKTGLSIGEVVLIVNVFIFSIAIYFLQVERVLYSLLTYFVATKMLDFIVYGLDERISLTIISEKSEKIRKKITSEANRRVTLMKGKTGYRLKEQDILFCVVTKYEIRKIQTLVLAEDEKAFITIQKIVDMIGGSIR